MEPTQTSSSESERLSPELAKELIDMIESVEKEEADQKPDGTACDNEANASDSP